ncbi:MULTISPECIES: F0F1 ATP synthase subunit B [Clostridium]|uniref:ATP synthase subunit b n=1 Tax=Clostridium paridis TaxID=2803863 RepID=A0A937FGD5_9CLOT|nr:MULTISPECIES: F0F1 ATP synthase subunit B [Clostridium]MBL4932678.1 F0F1 ATP synthase subunit B [Clostridium paridis]MDD7792698.1 F0F1 ATP synthase subunit B [Clostridium sp. 'White wine YQ']
MDINVSTIIFTIINFIILLLVLRHFFFDKVKNIIQERRVEIEDKMTKADEDLEKARLFKVENERILKSAKDEGKGITESYKQKADKIYNEIVQDANKEASIIMDRAKLEVEREKQKAEAEIKKQVVDLAVMLSEKALEESIDEEKHRKLINDFIAKVGI